MKKMIHRENALFASIAIFVILFVIINYYKPSFLYNNDGSIREFGIGYKNKTILPIWLFSIILGILSYIGIMYYLLYFM
jgi:hypothetical protein